MADLTAFAKKAAYRKTLARLPFEEKLRRVVLLQKRANAFYAARGKKISVWGIA